MGGLRAAKKRHTLPQAIVALELGRVNQLDSSLALIDLRSHSSFFTQFEAIRDARKFDQAIERAHDTLEMDANFAISYVVLGEAYLSKGMYREGLCALEKYSALSRSSAASLALLGYAHARSDERKESLQMIDKLISASKQSFVPALFIAMVYAGLEDKDQAFSWLEKAYEERFNRLAYLKVEALWDPIRPDSRFADLLRRVGIPP